MSALTPVRGAESQDGEGQSQSGQGQGEQGARATGQMLQHGHTGEDRGRGRLERWEERGGQDKGDRRCDCSHSWSREGRTDALGWF